MILCVADRLAQLDVELSIARRFASRVMALQDAGQRPIAEASMAKIYVTEFVSGSVQILDVDTDGLPLN